ncbi:MAG: carbon-nitrogen hydrolase family protein [Pyrinomonadaceae bacterium]|nr:carbon-nitrogen hydrolase family protein [Pyrinomonadaceae bacterium]
MSKTIVSIVQASPVFMNLNASVTRAVGLIEQAWRKGAKLIAFGETWLPGYPAWLDHSPHAALWNHEPTREVFAQLRRNSVVVPGKETETLGEVARELGVVVVIGVNERVDEGAGNGTLYNSLLTFGADGTLLNHHRKLVPTYTERLVWGQGDAAGLEAVTTSAGRVGGLVCWEHWMPLARQAMHTSGEHIHVAVFPTVHEMHQIASRHYAFEGRCFVLAAGLLMKAGDLPAGLTPASELVNTPEKFLLRGGSCIIAPDGSYVVEPVFDEELVITAELDLTLIDKEKMTLDVTGHYFRPDVFNLEVNRGTRRMA